MAFERTPDFEQKSGSIIQITYLRGELLIREVGQGNLARLLEHQNLTSAKVSQIQIEGVFTVAPEFTDLYEMNPVGVTHILIEGTQDLEYAKRILESWTGNQYIVKITAESEG